MPSDQWMRRSSGTSRHGRNTMKKHTAKHDQEGRQHHQFVYASVHAQQANGPKTELHSASTSTASCTRKPARRKRVMQMVAVGMEERPHPHASQHDAQGVDQRHANSHRVVMG